MINAIQKIGEYVAGKQVNKESFLENICLYIEPEREIKQKDGTRKKEKQHIIFVNFNTKDKKIEYDFEEINANNKNTALEYFFVGNASSNSPKIYVTSNNFSNVIQSMFYLGEKEKLLDNFFIKKTFKNGKVENYINPSFFRYSDKNKKRIDEITEIILDENDEKKIKKPTAEILKIVEKEVIKSLGLTSDEVSHYTIKIDNQLVCKKDQYPDIIFTEKIEKLFSNEADYKKYYKEKSICSICSSKGIPTTSNATNLKFKFYMTDKLGFSSNLDGHFKNNYNICKNCYQHLMIAERYINEKLRSRIGGLNVYILPKFVLPVDDFEIDEFARFISFKNQQISDISKAENILEEDLEVYENFNNKYLINYLFYQKSKSEFKILKLIEDIPPSRIEFIKRKEQDISRLVDEEFGGNSSIKIDLNRIWGCIPVKIEKDGMHGYSKYLEVIDSIFTNRYIDYYFLINQVLYTLEIIKFETPKFNIWYKEDIVNKIICINLLLLFLKKLNILGGGNMSNQSNPFIANDLIPVDITEYWENLGIYQDNQKKGLFLLGYLMGEIGNKQSSQQIKNKPILNKINFQGIGTEKLKRLSSDILEKLKQYQLLGYNENIYSASHILIEENLDNWTLSNQENVFYIMSGFAFSNFLTRKRGKENFIKEYEEKSNLVEILKVEEKNIEEFVKKLEEARLKSDEHKYYDARQILKEIKKN